MKTGAVKALTARIVEVSSGMHAEIHLTEHLERLGCRHILSRRGGGVAKGNDFEVGLGQQENPDDKNAKEPVVLPTTTHHSFS